MTQKVHHQTERWAILALTKEQISQASYEAILRGELSLARAKELGREGWPEARTTRGGQDEAMEAPEQTSEDGTDGPPQPVSRTSKEDRSRLCMCACGTRTKGGRFAPGHDVRMVSYAKEYLRGERELTDEQMIYVRDSGKLERARTRLAEEERRRREQAARKAERQAKAQTKDEK